MKKTLLNSIFGLIYNMVGKYITFTLYYILATELCKLRIINCEWVCRSAIERTQ